MALFDHLKNKQVRLAMIRQAEGGPLDAPGDRRVIQTGRTVEAINAAARAGLRPLVKPVVQSKVVHERVAVFQHPETGEIEVSGDSRAESRGRYDGYTKVLDYTYYYPNPFPLPFAAYLLPEDLAVDEIVWLEDLIEDLVAIWGNQGYHPRLSAAPALWNGSDFEILFDPERDASHWIG